jgi:O-antigen/teichoic acid export membrane protein
VSANDTREEADLGTRAASGVAWLAAQKWAVRASGFLTLLVLTRQLSPEEFGVVAVAMTVIPFVYLLADLGFSTYLLQADDVDERSLSTAWWMSVAAGAVLSIGMYAAAPALAAAFRLPELTPVLRALVLAVVATVGAGVPLALLRRAMAFRAVALQGLVAAAVAQVVAVVVALLGGGVWALVAQVVVGQWLIALLAWRGARWRPSLVVSPAQFRVMATFGVRVSAVDLVATSRMWVETWIITVTLGPAAMGLLSIAQRLVLTAQELTAGSLVPVSTVVFAKVRESADRLKGSYVKALGVAYALVSPFMTVIVVTAPVLVPLLFGERWVGSVPAARALSVAGIITLGAMVDHGLLYGVGRPGTWLGYALVVDAVTVSTTAVAVRWGLLGVALGFVVVAVLATVARWVLVGRVLRMPVHVVARPFGTVLVPTVLTMAAGLLTMQALDGVGPPAVRVAVGVLTVGVVDLVLLRLLATGVLRDAVSIVPLPRRMSDTIGRLLRLSPRAA